MSDRLQTVERIEALLAAGQSQHDVAEATGAPRKLVASVADGTWETRQMLAAQHGQPSVFGRWRCPGCGQELWGRKCLVCRDRAMIARYGPPPNGSPAMDAIPLKLEPEHRRRYLKIRHPLAQENPMTATARKPTRKSARRSKDPEAMAAELERYDQYFEELSVFTDFLRRQRAVLAEAQARTLEAKAAYDEARRNEAEIRDSLDGAKESLLRVLEPGMGKFYPLFDTMEPADEERHGEHADKWRKEPIAALRLSPVATDVLLKADVILVGQLQDRVMEDEEGWWQSIEGLHQSMAAAIADKLSQFIYEETSK